MKRIVLFICIVLQCGLDVFSQQDLKLPDEMFPSVVEDAFLTDWIYFRMKKNPLITDKERFREDGWEKTPYQLLLPEKYIENHYCPDIKISNWASQRCFDCFQIRKDDNYYLIEKENGLTSKRRDWNWFAKGYLDTIYLNIYDTIFPYDNRFLAYIDSDGTIVFYSGNVLWNKPFVRNPRVHEAGCLRGVQFGVDGVKYFKPAFSDSIQKLRPEYPDYEYTYALESMLSNGMLLIGAPKGKAKDYIEYIFYSQWKKTTGDEDGVWYEMRYVLPTEIKSVDERRMIKRKLTNAEFEILKTSILRDFVDRYIIYEEEIE